MKFEYSVLEAEDIDEAYALEAECFSRPWKRKDFEDAVENSGLYLFMKARGDDGRGSQLHYCRGLWKPEEKEA